MNQKIVIALPLEEKLLTPLREWGRKFDFEHVDHVHFVHVIKINITPLEFGLVESPDDSTYREMVPTIKKFLEEEAKRILPSDFKGNVTYEIEKDSDPEEETVDILKREHPDFIVVSSHARHGLDSLLHSSFTDYMIKHAPCDVFVVRPHEQDFRQSA